MYQLRVHSVIVSTRATDTIGDLCKVVVDSSVSSFSSVVLGFTNKYSAKVTSSSSIFLSPKQAIRLL